MSPQIPIILVPELFRVTGGVQIFSRRFVLALDEIYGTQLPVISMNDRMEDLPPWFIENRSVKTCGEFEGWKRKCRFLKEVWGHKDAGVMYSTHPHPTPCLHWMKKVSPLRYLAVAHGIDVWNIQRKSLLRGLTSSDLILPVSQFTADRLIEQLGAEFSALEVISNTVDTDQFFPSSPKTPWRERLKIPTQSKVILTVTRLDHTEHRKGYDLLLESIPALLKWHPDLHWILAGKGNDIPRVTAKANELGLVDRCHVPGFIEDHELADLYRSADLFVLPSQKEGFGIVFLEAAACGLPVIGGNRDGSKDALANGKLGTLIDPTSMQDLTTAIHARLLDPACSPEDQHQRCKELFGIEAFRNHLKNILLKHAFIVPGTGRSTP